MRDSSVAAIHETTDILHASGHPMHVERFEPPDLAEAAVVILHGADGLIRRGPAYRSLAGDLARHGYRTLLPHYLESTGTGSYAFAAKPLDALGWLAAVGEVTGRAGDVPVGLIGFSLGAYLAISAAGQDERVAAVVDCFGGLPDFAVAQFDRMPPVLILHGEADPIVPVSEAHRLAKWLADRGTRHETKVYPGLGHNFIGAPAADARARILTFLDRNLRPAWASQPGAPSSTVRPAPAA
jgi:carboxymethylenebutenolidase